MRRHMRARQGQPRRLRAVQWRHRGGGGAGPIPLLPPLLSRPPQVLEWARRREKWTGDEVATLRGSIAANLQGQFGAPVFVPVPEAAAAPDAAAGAAAGAAGNGGEGDRSPPAKRQRIGSAAGGEDGTAVPSGAGLASASGGASTAGASSGDGGQQRQYRSALLSEMLGIRVPRGEPTRPTICLDPPDEQTSTAIAAGRLGSTAARAANVGLSIKLPSSMP